MATAGIPEEPLRTAMVDRLRGHRCCCTSPLYASGVDSMP